MTILAIIIATFVLGYILGCLNRLCRERVESYVEKSNRHYQLGYSHCLKDLGAPCRYAPKPQIVGGTDEGKSA